MIQDLILKNRSYRRFDEKVKISMEELEKMINAARFSASAKNSQALKYVLSVKPEMNKDIFDCLAWAGYLKEWAGPGEGERPTAYIVQLHDTLISPNYFCDDGIAAQSILLTAVELGYGGCIIASVNKEKLSKILKLTENLKLIQVIALGKPAEKIVIEEVKNNDIKYWRDENDVHHVPKRSLTDLILNKIM